MLSFVKFFESQNLDPDSLKSLDPDSMNLDPKHCF